MDVDKDQIMTRIATVAAALCVAGLHAGAAGTLSAKDRRFLQQDAQGGAYEMQLARLALQKSADPRIKQFAQQDVSDHTALNQQAEQIARQNQVAIQTSVAPDKQAKLDHLGTLTGAAFDKAFISEMKAINKEDKSDFKEELGDTKNDQIKQFVQQGQAIDRKHEKIVDTL